MKQPPSTQPQPASTSRPLAQNISSLLKQPPITSAYWLGRWFTWQNLRTQAKSKLKATVQF